VIDTDSQPDDWIAITWLLARNDATVRAITVSGSSTLGCDGSMRHVLRLLALAGKTGVPVACGRPTSAAADHLFPADWLPSTQALTDVGRLPEPVDAPSARPAVDVLRAAISTSPAPVVLVALGPLTNVADLLASADPGATANIADIVVMGGAVDVAGNVGGDHAAAEWNVFVDPAAANDVLRSGAHVTLIALDA
jgi:pyrimidine-specific ribonucleoside hydrolase